MTYKPVYNKVSDENIKDLIDMTSPERVFVKDAINLDYYHDEMPEYGKYPPEAVVEVLTTEEVSNIMRYCWERSIPVVPRGSGTGLCGGAVAKFGGVMLSTAKMNKVIGIDMNNLTITVEPGLMLMELAAIVQEKGLLYPPDPGEKSATIGGNVMTNAGGMRAVKYGVTRDYVRAMEVVLSDGTVINLGSNVAKNSSGYSLLDILIGSEGTLGFVTKITLELIPLPKRSVSLLVPFPDLDKCIDTVPKFFENKLIPTTLEFMQREVIMAAEEYLGKVFPDKGSDAYLILSFDGNTKEETDSICDSVAQVCLDCGAEDVFISDTEERKEAIWSARGAFLEAIKSSTPAMDECDVVVPRDRIADFVKFVNGLEKECEIRIRSFGHAGDGNIHVYVCKDDLEEDVWMERLNKVMKKMYDKSEEMGGQVSGEHGIGHAKVGYLEQSLGEKNIQIMEGIKAAFDPKFILNPGKVYCDKI